MAPPVRQSDRWLTAVVVSVVFLLSCLYTLPSPYFLDSFGYVTWIQEWRRYGELPSHYRYANTLLYYWPVVLFGEVGLKVVGVAVTTMLAALYWWQIRRDFSATTAVGASLLFFSAPPTVITATHLKEDLTSLLCFSASVLLVGRSAGAVRIAAAGAAYGLSLLFKEALLGAAPFLVAYVHLRADRSISYRQCFETRRLLASGGRVALFAAAAGIMVLAVSPTRIGDYAHMAGSPYMGQFLGLFSAQQAIGLRFWIEALLHLHPWYLIAVGFFVAHMRQRGPVQGLYPIIALVLLVFLANISVVRMRHYVVVFFFLAPVLFEGTRAAVDTVAEILGLRGRARGSAAGALAICAVVAAANLAYVHPTIDYRLRYSSARGFFAPLSRALPGDALLLGMDNCPIAAYASGLRCENHPPDLDAAGAGRYAERIAAELAQRPVYLLPDFLDYDSRGAMRRAFEARFASRPVYSGWWEPYHAMTYGEALDETVGQLLRQRPDCHLESRRTQPVAVSDDLTIDTVTLRLRCRDGGSSEISLNAYRGHRVMLRRSVVSAVETL